MRHTCPVVAAFALLFVVAGSRPALADQLQCNSKKDAARAAELLKPGSWVLDFCSTCEDDVQVIEVREAKVIEDCDFEVQVAGTVVARSTQAYRETYPKDARYDRVDDRFEQEIDLAYAYIETAPNVFNWLGGVLRLKADVKVKTISLPKDLYGELVKSRGTGANQGRAKAEVRDQPQPQPPPQPQPQSQSQPQPQPSLPPR